ncbi:beta-ketoacyl-[acyl-carrier-protein] synthase family protein [bacterium]|nr:beta-ketoacyl-[acyl-carrier-protein] synthase family protein [bacterium]
MKDRVVISGIGVLSPNGVDKDAFREGLRVGKSGISTIRGLDLAMLQTKVAGQVEDAVLASLIHGKDALKRHDRTTVLALIAAQRAAADARFDADVTAPYKRGLVFGSACGPVHSLEGLYTRYYEDKEPYVQPSQAQRAMLQTTALEISRRFGLTTLSQTTNSGDASSLAALAAARQYILAGMVDIVFVGGADCPIQQHYYRLWDSLRLLTREGNSRPEQASRPFALDRSGMVLSEGAGFLVVEREETAIERRADIYAEVQGAGLTTQFPEDLPTRAKAQADCIKEALRNASVEPGAIDHIQAQAGGSPVNDLSETQAIKEVFGKRAADIPISAVKSMVGNTLGASGCIGIIAGLLAMRTGFLPPTINLEKPDPQCDLDYVPNESREASVRTVLVNAFDEAGTNVAVVLRSLD